MLKALNLKTKIVALALLCVTIPTLTILTTIYLKSDELSQSVDKQMKQTTMARLEDMTKSIRESIAQASRSAIISTCVTIAGNGRQTAQIYYDQYRAGLLTEKEARQKAASDLLSLKIGENRLYLRAVTRRNHTGPSPKIPDWEKPKEVRFYRKTTGLGRLRLPRIPMEESR